MKRPTLREVASTTGVVLWGLAGLFVVGLASPVAAAIGGFLGFLAGLGVILLGMLMIALIQ